MEIKTDTTANQYLSFILRDEYFAIEIYKVREVLDVTTLTKIPRMPDYLCGVINLRGNVVDRCMVVCHKGRRSMSGEEALPRPHVARHLAGIFTEQKIKMARDVGIIENGAKLIGRATTGRFEGLARVSGYGLDIGAWACVDHLRFVPDKVPAMPKLRKVHRIGVLVQLNHLIPRVLLYFVDQRKLPEEFRAVSVDEHEWPTR